MRLLIISYTFPPFGGIGGRRWAKFCKFMQLEGIDFTVCASSRGKHISGWTKDIESYRDKIIYFDDLYPAILALRPITLPDKLLYKFSKMVIRLVVRNGNYYDTSYFFNNKVVRYISNNPEYTHIIISGAPFRSAYDITKLKSNFSDIKFIIDFRDPWVSNMSHYGLKSMSFRRQKFESFMEKESIRKADLVLSVSDEMNTYFKNLEANNESKFKVLTNGFDPQELRNKANIVRSQKLRFIFAGNLYDDCRHLFIEFTKALAKLLDEDPSISDQVQFDFYGTVPSFFFAEMRKTNGLIKYCGNVSVELAQKKISESDVTMLFLTNDMGYSKSTKFYEYVAMKKPVAVFSSVEGTGKFVEENGVGMDCRSGTMYDKILEIIVKHSNRELVFNKSFPTEEYNLEILTKRLISFLRSI